MQLLEKYKYQEIESYLKSYCNLQVFLLAPACNSLPFCLFSVVFTAVTDCLLKGLFTCCKQLGNLLWRLGNISQITISVMVCLHKNIRKEFNLIKRLNHSTQEE